MSTGRCLLSRVRRVISARMTRKGGRAVALGGQAEFPGDGFVHIHHVSRRERDVKHPVQPGVQSGADLTADGGFTAAGLTGEQAHGAQLQQVLEADFRFTVGGGIEQGVGFEILLERIPVQGEVMLVHRRLLRFDQITQCQRRGRWLRGGLLAGEGVAGTLAFDEAVGVRIHGPGVLQGLMIMPDLDSTSGRGRIVTQGDPLADQRGIDLVDDAVEADGAVGFDLAHGLEQEQIVEIDTGLDEADPLGRGRPVIERGSARPGRGAGCNDTRPRSRRRGGD